MTPNIPKTVWLGLAAFAAMIFIIVPGMVLISTSRVTQTGATESGLGFYYWFQWAIIFGLFALLVPKKNDATKAQWLMAILIPAFVGIGIYQYNQSGWGVSTKQDVISSNSCAQTGNCPRYTAMPGTRSFGHMRPITLQPGQESLEVRNFTGSMLVWSLVDGNQMPQIFSKIGNDGAWQAGCIPGAWQMKFALPHNASQSVTLQLERLQLGSTSAESVPLC